MAENVNMDLLKELQALQITALKDRLAQDIADGIPTDAATHGVIAKILKDNACTVDPADSDQLGELRRKLAEQQAARSRPLLAAVKSDLKENVG